MSCVVQAIRSRGTPDASSRSTLVANLTNEAWRKIALTAEQVETNPRLRELQIEKVDRRNKPPKSYNAIECEALGKARSFARVSISNCRSPTSIPWRREEAERETMRRRLARMRR
jgi:hypothetical protein